MNSRETNTRDLRQKYGSTGIFGEGVKGCLPPEDSDNVVVFRRDRRSGELEDSGKRVNMKTARQVKVSFGF